MNDFQKGNAKRIVIVGGPRTGKSYLAQQIHRGMGAAVYCGDPLSKVKEPLPGVNYLPEGLPFDGDTGAAQWIVDNWFTMPGPWVMEGHVMARALRRWTGAEGHSWDEPPLSPCDLVYVFEEQRPEIELLPGQVAMHKGVLRVWSEIADVFSDITVYL